MTKVCINYLLQNKWQNKTDGKPANSDILGKRPSTELVEKNDI